MCSCNIRGKTARGIRGNPANISCLVIVLCGRIGNQYRNKCRQNSSPIRGKAQFPNAAVCRLARKLRGQTHLPFRNQEICQLQISWFVIQLIHSYGFCLQVKGAVTCPGGSSSRVWGSGRASRGICPATCAPKSPRDRPSPEAGGAREKAA